MSEAFARQLPAKMSARIFDSLPEYSCTIPDGKTIGKRWKRREPYGVVEDTCRDGRTKCECHRWFMGEYVPHAHPDVYPELVYIIWTEIERLP